MLERLSLEHLPPGYQVWAALFTEVENAAFLHSQLLARNAAFEYAFVDASVLVSRSQILAAIYQAVSAHATNALKTPNVHSETVVALSPSLNISEAYRRYGIMPGTKSVIAVKILTPGDSATQDQIWNHLNTNVQGKAMAMSESNIAQHCTDVAKVVKYFKLSGAPALAGKPAGSDGKLKELEALVLGAMALRGL